MLLCFINHGFQVKIVLIVAPEVWNHSLLRRYGAFAVHAGSTSIKLVDVLWSDILEWVCLRRVYKLGTYLYGSGYCRDEGQVQLARIEHPDVWLWTFVAPDHELGFEIVPTHLIPLRRWLDILVRSKYTKSAYFFNTADSDMQWRFLAI